MLALCHWIDRTPFFVSINSWTPLAILLEVVHYFSLFMIVGSMGIVDFRILGILGRKQNVADLADDMLPWMWIGVVLNVISGFVMFSAEATAYYQSPPFRIKMLLVLLAIVFGIVVNRNAAKWGQLSSIPPGAKVVAFVAIVLWISAILTGNEVPAISGTG